MFLKLYNKLIEYDVDFVNSGFKKNDCNEIFCAGREQKIHIINMFLIVKGLIIFHQVSGQSYLKKN